MIEIKTGNIFDSSAECLVNTVNCEGFMGKGIAYQFKTKFPKNNLSYIKACNSGQLTVGELHVFNEDEKTIVNFPTKDRWRAKSQYSYIQQGMDKLVQLIKYSDFSTIAIPPLGCGNGGLEWGRVKEIIENKLDEVTDLIYVELYAPSKDYAADVKEAPKLTFSHYLLMLLKSNLGQFNTFRLQKAAFLLNLFSNKNYFKFAKYHYGPYAHSIDILATQIREYQKYYKLETRDALPEVKRVLISKNFEKSVLEFEAYVNKAASFINSIESDRELELISSVLFLINTGELKQKLELPGLFKKWSKRKENIFSEVEILNSISELESKNVVRPGISGYEFVFD